MQGFEDVTLSYKGADYTIQAKNMLLAVAEVEEALRGTSDQPAIKILLRPGGPSYPRLCLAYGAALKASGAVATAQEAADYMYLSIQQDFAEGGASTAAMVQNAVFVLLKMIAPPVAMAIENAGKESDEEPGEVQAAG